MFPREGGGGGEVVPRPLWKKIFYKKYKYIQNVLVYNQKY